MKNNIHETLMDEAYDLFQKNKEWTKEDFYYNLDVAHREAVALGNLNYQVGNGGFSQWNYNGYKKDSSYILRAILSKIKNNTEFNELQKGLELAINYVPSSSGDDDSEYEEKNCDDYYALKNIEEQMEKYLTK